MRHGHRSHSLRSPGASRRCAASCVPCWPTPPRRACRASIISRSPLRPRRPACGCPIACARNIREAMTIVLQHQFWDLSVDDDGFEVGLSFGGVPERLACRSTPSRRSTIRRCNSVFSSRPSKPRQRRRRDGTKPRQPPPSQSLPTAPAKPRLTPEAEQPTKPRRGAEVVRLDRFRKNADWLVRDAISAFSRASERRAAGWCWLERRRAESTPSFAARMKTRTETDFFGPIEVPGRSLLGRADRTLAQQFPHRRRTHAAPADPALALVKRAAAETNRELGSLDARRAKAIVAGGAGNHRRQARRPFSAGRSARPAPAPRAT